VVGVLLHVTVERRNLGRWRNAAHKCRRRQNFGVRRIWLDFPKLARKNFGPLFVRTFSQEGLLLGWPPKIGLHVILQKLGAIFFKSNLVGRHFCPDFQGFIKGFHRFYQVCTDFDWIFKDFARIFNILKLLGVRVHSLHPHLLHYWCSNTVTADSG